MKRLLAALVVIFAGSVLGVAQDSISVPSAQSTKGPTNIQSAPPSADVVLQMLRQSRTGNQPIAWRLGPGATLSPTPNVLTGDCYTMRIYKVKRAERLQNGDTGSRGYSTCEPGSNFQVRTATATATDQPRSK